MAAAGLPVPSRGLLRFLRLQTANLGFFSPNHGPESSRVFCAAKKQLRPSRTACASLGPEEPRLQSSLINLERLLQNQTPRALPNPRPRQSTLFKSEIGTRWSSTDKQPDPAACKQNWQGKLWGSGPRKAPASGLKPEDIPETDGEGENNSMFNKPRQLSSKAALEPRLRCTEVDANGEAAFVDSEFKKSELVARFGLLPRDLRKIDSSNLPHILVRERAILVNLLHLRVLVTHNRVLLFDVYGSKSSYPQSAFMYDLQHKLQNKTAAASGGLSYEFRALEAVLQSVTQELESDFEAVRDPVIRILSDLEDDIDRHKLRILLILSKRVSTFEQKAKLVRDAIEDLLEADDDLAAMYLTEKTHDIYRAPDDHTDVELLLESYHKFCDEIVQESGNLVSGIRNTEEIIRAILDANRNALMLLELKFSVGTLGLAMGTFIAGLYGMNLENFIEETNWGFGAVTGVSVILSVWVCVIGMKRLRSLQRVKMAGTDRRGVEQGYHWFQDDGHAGLLDPRSREKLRRMNMMKNQHTTSKKKWWMGA
ncbi:inner membrane magnesium transporter MRS2 [Apiospora kogelbergensis]|uniref:inner membrane magnesium transporter MRS2 n=1 Tax=Apiospora kogelbergensis TaxID=1337665 RepID=UPI00313073C0